jgi:hypothetical protein
MGDAITKLVISNGVDVTTICNLGRYIPSSLKSALIERDRTCVVPHCDVAHGLEFDHWGTSFADGGTVSLENIARLCGHHHYLRTHKGFRLSGGPGRWRWDPPPPPGESAGADGGVSSRDGPSPPKGETEGGGDIGESPLFTLEE